MPLAVDVATDGDGCSDGLDVGFVHECFTGFFAEGFDFGFGKGCSLGEFGEPGF